MRNTRTRRAAAAIAAIALVATACGSDADGDGTAAATGDATGSGAVPDAPDDGVTSDAIRIGWMGDVTGPIASAQVPNLRGTEAYFELVNAEGGVAGRDLELIVKDDEYGAEAGVANFQALVNDDRVLAINQVGGAHIQEAVAPDAERIGVPLVSLAQSLDSGLDNPYVFQNLALYADMARVAVARMADRLGSAEDVRVGVIHLEVPSGEEWDSYIREFTEAEGGTYLGKQTISPGQSDAGALMANLRQMVEEDDLNYIALHGGPADVLFVVNSMASAGIEVPIVGNQGSAGITVYSEGDAAQTAMTEGIHSFLSVSDDSEGGEQIRAFLEGEGSAYAGDATHLNFTHGWVGGMIMHQAIERASETGELTRASFHEALQGEFDTAGLTCPIDWSERNYVPCAAPFTSTDGESMEIVGSLEDWTPYLGGGSEAG